MLKVCIIFFYVGLIMIGGGLAGIPIMQREIVGRGLISIDDFFNMVALSESTPGPIGVNLATFVGYRLFGVFGGILTTFSLVLPSLITIIIVAKAMRKLFDLPPVSRAFAGIKSAVCAMLLLSVWNVWKISLIDCEKIKTCDFVHLIRIPQIFFFVAAFITLQKTKLHPIIVVAAGAIFGAIFL